MFAAHGWSADGRVVSQVAPTHVKKTYGSVAAFEKCHDHGVEGNALLDPRVAITGVEPDVWLSEFIDFSPETQGYDAYMEKAWRDHFIEHSQPGALMIAYHQSRGKRRVCGILELTHVIGGKQEFDTGNSATAEEGWEFAVKAIRGWKVEEDAQPVVEDFAPDTFTKKNRAQIDWQGMKLTRQEALKVLDLPLREVDVAGDKLISAALPGLCDEVLRPSRPGPVSQSPRVVMEAEGPKHLYILQLEGDADAFLGKNANGGKIVKVGFSVSPVTRRNAHNRALPKCAFKWTLLHSTYDEGMEPFQSSKHALAGEDTMKSYLDAHGKSLGGEFFLAPDEAVKSAWRNAITAARNWKA